MSGCRIVAIGLLLERDLERLSGTFRDAIPVSQDLIFADLLAQLDRIEGESFGKGVLLGPDPREIRFER